MNFPKSLKSRKYLRRRFPFSIQELNIQASNVEAYLLFIAVYDPILFVLGTPLLSTILKGLNVF